MSEIAICADLHFGYANRLSDITWACKVLNAYCADHDIDTIINLGDLTHDRKSIDIDVYCAIYDTFKAAKTKGINWYTLLGNHDMHLKHSWEINSAKPLSDLITVIDSIKLLIIDDTRWWVIPFIHFEKSYMRVLAEINNRAEEGDNLLTHIGVRGSNLNTCFMIKDWSFVHFNDTKFRRVYTGHFHTYQQVEEKTWYPGSIIPFKHDEGNVPHGFLTYNTVTHEHVFHDIWEVGAQYFPGPSPPQFLTVLDTQVEDLTPSDVAGNIVRIALTREYTQDEKIQLKASLSTYGASQVGWLVATADAINPSFHKGTKLTSPGELFIRWIDTDKPDHLDRSLLIKLETEYRAEGDERYTYTELE